MSSKETKKFKKRNILVCCSGYITYPEEQVIQGIRRFALTRPEWRLGILHNWSMDEAILRDVRDWEPEGILVVTPYSRLPGPSTWRKIPQMVVDLRHERPEGLNRIEIDSCEVGKRAARYFLENGFQHFAIALWPKNPPFSRIQEEGFTNELGGENHCCARFEITEGAGRPWHRNPALDAWLLDLPKPGGLFCVSDATALRIMEHCDRLNIGIPSELSVLSAGNDPRLCETTRPTLSSIHMNSDAMGYRAATRLHEYLESGGLQGDSEAIFEVHEPGEIVVRESSSIRAIADPDIAKAANYLLEHAALGVSIDDAARESGINRRKLERGFKRYLGVTPGEYLRRLKIDHAKRLITETDLRMNEVAYACGMAPEHFSNLFRKETGKSPGAYRKEKSRGSPPTNSNSQKR
jgi:LacI family transcriptional regulator